jgi:hypothetical protein
MRATLARTWHDIDCTLLTIFTRLYPLNSLWRLFTDRMLGLEMTRHVGLPAVCRGKKAIILCKSLAGYPQDRQAWYTISYFPCGCVGH